MRICSAYFLLFTILLSLLAGVVLGEGGKGPELTVEQREHDFGRIYRGQRLTYIFKLENHGSGELIISNIRASCGCTAAWASTRMIPPGGSAELEVSFNSENFAGQVRKTVIVDSNDSREPHLELAISANIVEEVSVNPVRLKFGEIRLGELASLEVELKPKEGFDLEVLGVESTLADVLEARIEKRDEKNFVVAAIKKEAPVGRFNGNVIVLTNSRFQPKIPIFCFGEIISELSVFPPQVSFGYVERGDENSRWIIITPHQPHIKVKKVELQAPEFLSLQLPGDLLYSSHTQKIVIKLRGDAPAGRFDGFLRIHTNGKVQPLLTVPVCGEVREK